MADVAVQTIATFALAAVMTAIISTLYIGQYYWTHRRFTALFLLFWVFVGFSVSSPELQAALASPGASWQARLLLAIRPVIMLMLLIQALHYAWWQWRISRSEFLAARGWRPSIWRTWTSLALNLGVPPFVIHTKRGFATLVLLYYLTAVAGGVWIFALAAIEPYGDSSWVSTDAATLWSAGGGLLTMALVLTALGAPNVIRRVADKFAVKAYQNVRDWDARAPIIFLRQFDQDKARLRAEGIDPFIRLPVGAARPRTIDELLLENASPYGPVIAIGDPRNPLPPLGAARVFVPGDGADWQSTVSALVDASKGVVICPASSEGVRWEIELLSGRYAHAWAIYLANPEVAEAESRQLLEACVGEPIPADIKKGQVPIVAYQDGVPDRWLLLTARKRTLPAYTVALNLALQAMFGLQGEDVPKLMHERPQSSA